MPDQTLPTNLTISLRPEQYDRPYVPPPDFFGGLAEEPAEPPLTIRSILEAEDAEAARQRTRELQQREQQHEPLPYPEGFRDSEPSEGRGVWGTYAPAALGGDVYEKWTAEDEGRFQPTYAKWAVRYGLDPDPDAPEQTKDWRREFKEGRRPTEADRKPVKASARPPGWTPAHEAKFKQWYATAAAQTGINPDADAPDQKYNYRYAFAAGAWPDADGHWPSKFKAADHPNRYVQEGLDTIDSITGQALSPERRPSPAETEGLSLFELATQGAKPTGLTRSPEIPAPGDSLWARVHNRKRQLEALPKGTGIPKNAAARALVRAVLPGGDSVAAATKFLSLADRALEIAAAPSDPEGDAFRKKLQAVAKESDPAKRRAAAKKPVVTSAKSKGELTATAAADLAMAGLKFPPVDYALRTLAGGAAALGAATKKLPERDIRAIHSLRNAVTGVNALRREQPLPAAETARDRAVDDAGDDPHTRYRNETPLQKAENRQRGEAILAGVSAFGDAPFVPLEEQPTVPGSLIERGFQMGPGEQALLQYVADPMVVDDLSGLPALAALASKGPALAMAIGRKGLKGIVPRTGPSVEKALMSRFRGKTMTGEALHKMADQTAGAEGVAARMSDWLGERWETPVSREEFAGELINDAVRRKTAATAPPVAPPPEVAVAPPPVEAPAKLPQFKYTSSEVRPPLREAPDPVDFITERDKSKRKGFLSPLAPEDLQGQKLYLSEDGTVGGALAPDGDMGNLFNNGGPKGAGSEVMLDMLRDGGRTADAYEGDLTKLYANFGLQETGRMKFDPAQAPPDWDYATYGKPDVVFLARTEDVGTADDIRTRLRGDKAGWIPRKPTTKYYDDYGLAKRDAADAAGRAADYGGGHHATPRAAGPADGGAGRGSAGPVEALREGLRPGVDDGERLSGHLGGGGDRGAVAAPRTIQFIRNTDKAPNLGERYGQHVEPAGRYINEVDPSDDPTRVLEKGWERGTVTFERPLVLDWGGQYGDPTNWKSVLSERYGGKTGAALSRAIKADGYDGIITMTDKGATSEIVDLTGFPRRRVAPETASKLAVAGTAAAIADDDEGTGALLGAAVLGGKSGARLAATAKTAALTARKAAKTARVARKAERTLGDVLQTLEGAYVTPDRVRKALATVNPAEVRARGLEPWLEAYGTKPIPRAELVANLSGSETARVMDQLKGGAFTQKRAREVVTSVLGADAVKERGLDKWFTKKRKNPLTRSQIEAELWKTEPGAPTPLAPTLAEAETQAQTTFGRGLEDLNDKELAKLVRATTGEDALYLMPPGARESWVKKQAKALAESVETGVLDRTRPVIQGAQDPTAAMRIAEDYARTGDDAARDAALASYPESVRGAVEDYGVAQRRLDTLFGARGLRKDPIDGNLISTNVITSKKAKPQTAMRETNLESFPEGSEIEANTAKLMLDSGILTDAEKAAATTPRQVIRASIDAMKRNLRALYEAYPQEWRERSRAWYQGAHRLAGEMAEEFGTTREQVAGVMASLSPTKDWFQNVELARRILTRVREFEKTPPVFTEALYNQFAQKMTDGTEFAVSKARSERAAAGRKLTSADERKMRAKRAKKIEKIRDLVGASWEDGDIKTKAYIFRAMEGLDFPDGQTFSVISPEGDVVRTATKKNGTDWRLVHQSYKFIGNAIEIAEMAPDTPFAQVMERVSAKLGGEHKVRSFYNNIINPWDKRSVTIDTHADAAAWLRPFSSKSAQVKQSMGGAGASKSATTGVSGTNGVIAQAYFELADEMNLARPSELQSVTWEAVRSLFEPSHKKVGGKAFTAIEDLHNQYISGKISHDKFFRFLKNTLRNADSHASGFRAPDWVTRPPSDKGRLVAGGVSPRDPVFSAGPGNHRGHPEGSTGASAP